MFLSQLAHGAVATIELTAYSALIGIALAIVAGTAMLSGRWWARLVARTYTEVFRGASELVLLFWIIFALPQFGVSISPFRGAVIALALNIGAYEAEVVRGAIQAVPRGQTEAAIALNMSPLLRWWRVVLPQAVVTMIPPLQVLTVQLLKGTALVSIVGITDLTFAGDKVINLTGKTVQIYSEVLVGYYVLAFVVNRLFQLLEWRLSWGRDVLAAARA